jgi:hypothetical protein
MRKEIFASGECNVELRPSRKVFKLDASHDEGTGVGISICSSSLSLQHSIIVTESFRYSLPSTIF